MPTERPRHRAQGGGSNRRPRRDAEEKQYFGVFGFMPFEPDDDETPDGTQVRRIKVQDGSRLYAVTVWDSHQHVELRAGMLVACQGTYNKSEGDDGTVYHNVSANKLMVIGEDDGVRSDDAPKKKKPAKKAAPKRRAAAPVDDDDDEDDDATAADDDDDDDDEDF